MFPAGCDPVPAVIGCLRDLAPDLVLCGMRAGGWRGERDGPYLVAEALGHAVVGDAASLECAADRATVVQGLPRGRRREVSVRLPAVVLVNGAASHARGAGICPGAARPDRRASGGGA